MGRDAYIKIYQPGPVFTRFRNFYDVVIDDAVVGEVWPRQAKVFEVAAGQHSVRLKYLFFIRSRTVTVSVDQGQVVELACWPNWSGFGPIGLHRATPSETTKMRELTGEVAPPRDIGAKDRST